MTDANIIKTAELDEAERMARVAHAEKISKATLAVEKVLLSFGLTWSEWGDIIESMNARSQTVFGDTKINSIKNSYEQRPA